jgi:hypothetical protein
MTPIVTVATPYHLKLSQNLREQSRGPRRSSQSQRLRSTATSGSPGSRVIQSPNLRVNLHDETT